MSRGILKIVLQAFQVHCPIRVFQLSRITPPSLANFNLSISLIALFTSLIASGTPQTRFMVSVVSPALALLAHTSERNVSEFYCRIYVVHNFTFVSLSA